MRGEHRADLRRVPDKHGEWWVPAATGRHPTVVLVHGGYWQPGFDRHLEDDVASDLCARGYLVWNIDYRPAADGWPAPLESAAAAYDQLTLGKCRDLVDGERVAVVGHSAGGQLALWLASRHRLPANAPGSIGGRSRGPALAVGQAPVAALIAAAHERLGGGAAIELCGGTPDSVPDRYRIADPAELAPASCPVVLIHARDDDVVPLSQSRQYEKAATAAGGRVRLVVLGGGHFEHLEPRSAACQHLRAVLESALGGPASTGAEGLSG